MAFTITNEYLVGGEVPLEEVQSLIKTAFMPRYGLFNDCVTSDANIEATELVTSIELCNLKVLWRELLGDLYITTDDHGIVSLNEGVLRSRASKAYFCGKMLSIIKSIYLDLSNQEGFIHFINGCIVTE